MWVKKRHQVVFNILRPFFYLHFKIKYNLTCDKRISLEQNSLILSNHVSTMDPFMISLLFKQNIYYMMSKDVLNHRFIGSLIKFLINPIAKEKSNKSDIMAIKNCMRVAKEKGTIAIFPEGNRTISGRLGNVDFSIVKLIKALKMPLIICNIQGSHPTDPRWGKTIRRGKVNVSIRARYSYDEIKDMDNEELYNLVIEKMTVDDFNFYPEYKGRKLAEHLEKVFYICPVCHKLHTIYTKGDKIYCSECGLEVTFNPNLRLTANKDSFNFDIVPEWYQWQLSELNKMDFNHDNLIYEDKMNFYISRPFQSKELIGKGVMRLYRDEFHFVCEKETLKFKFSDISSITLVGKKKMNIYSKGLVYQVLYDHKTNLLKYMQTFYVIKKQKGEIDTEFYGI